MLFAPFPSLFGKSVLPFGDSGSQFQARADIPAGCRQVISPPPSLSPVTHRDRPCAGFKTQFRRCTIERVFRLVGPIWNRGISLQIRRYCQGRKVCWLKFGWHYVTQTMDIVRQIRTHIFHKSRICHIFFFIAF